MTTVIISSAIIFASSRLSQETCRNLSRLTGILLQLGRNEVRQLAITTVILSSVFIFLLGMLTVRQLAMTMKTLFRIVLLYSNWEQTRSGNWP